MTRVIAGVARGRRLTAPSGLGTRPTTDRVREALFSALDSRLDGLDQRSLLDLYAGSGAIGCEALSRGMAPVRMVEQDRRAVAAIRGNLDVVGVAGGEVVRADVAAAVARPADRDYDVVFADPPYDLPANRIAQVLRSLLDGGWVDHGTLVVLERRTRSDEIVWPSALADEGRRRYGETTLWYRRHDPGPTDDPGRTGPALSAEE